MSQCQGQGPALAQEQHTSELCSHPMLSLIMSLLKATPATRPCWRLTNAGPPCGQPHNCCMKHAVVHAASTASLQSSWPY